MSDQKAREDFYCEADQLLRIARLELGILLEAACCLIVGTGTTAHDMVQELLRRGCAVVQTPVEDGGPFDLVVLLEQPEPGLLERLTADDGLVLDATTMKSSEWTVLDTKASYRRIRVLRLTRRGT